MRLLVSIIKNRTHSTSSLKKILQLVKLNDICGRLRINVSGLWTAVKRYKLVLSKILAFVRRSLATLFLISEIPKLVQLANLAVLLIKESYQVITRGFLNRTRWRDHLNVYLFVSCEFFKIVGAFFEEQCHLQC